MEALARPLRPDARPLYDQAIEALRQYLAEGRFQPGDRLPSEGDLARQLGISRSTLREAMGNLETNGLVTRRHGAGTFVAQPPQPPLQSGLEQLESLLTLAEREGVDVERRVWRVETCPAEPEVAATLKLALDSPVVNSHMTVALQEGPFAYLHSFISAQHVSAEELSAFAGGSLLDYLNQWEVLRISSSRSEVYSVGAQSQVAQQLGVPVGSPLLYLREVQYNEAGQPLVLSLNYFRTDSYKFHIIRRSPRR